MRKPAPRSARKPAQVVRRTTRPAAKVKRPSAPWTFLTNHAHVILLLARQPDLRLRDVAAAVGITERAVQRIVAELEAGGVLAREKEGRCNRYDVHRSVRLRHAVEAHCTVGDLIVMVVSKAEHRTSNAERRTLKV